MATKKGTKLSDADWASAASFAQKIDRESLPGKTRVHALAKQLGIASRQLVAILAERGVTKIAQSTLSPEEAGATLDYIVDKAEFGEADKDDAEKPKKKSKSDAKKYKKASTKKKSAAKKSSASKDNPEAADGEKAEEEAESEPKAAAPKKSGRKRRRSTRRAVAEPAAAEVGRDAEEDTAQEPDATEADGTDSQSGADAAAEEKLRTRVRKNVDNELSQIRDKVDAELKAETDEQSGEPTESELVSADQSRQDGASREEAADLDDEKLRSHVRNNVANEISQIEEKVERELEEAGEDPSFTSTPPMTAMPADEHEDHETDSDGSHSADNEDGYDYAPIFLAPTVDDDADVSGEVDEALAAVVAAAENSAGHLADEREQDEAADSSFESEHRGGRRRRGRGRGRRGASRGRGAKSESKLVNRDENGVEIIEEPKAIRGSTRIEARRRRRAEMRDRGRERSHIVSQAEFLARRESVERLMVVRDRKREDGPGLITQVGVLEDGLLVEHFVTSEAQASIVGNVYLGRVQNVLPSMEAAFVDIGTGRNGVLYAGDFDWRGTGLSGRARKIENALKSGDQVLVQVAKDPLGHKGARLTTQISLAGRYLVYVPKGKNAGISRKLPAPERKRLKDILGRVVPDDGGAIIRTAAEGVSEEAIAQDVRRLHDLWEDIASTSRKEKDSKGAKPVTLYEEPDTLIKVVRDLFNEDFDQLIVDGKRAFNAVSAYVDSMAPDLADRVSRFNRREHDGEGAFAIYRVDEQLQKALARKVWLPSGGTLIMDRTEAMTVIDVNTGKFTGSGGNLEETVTKNNLEAAEEIVRQMRLRDLGGMIVVDFIDMVLPENQELVLRRLKEALGRDRTRHQVSEVTSLGLVQMTRKRLGTGLLETFSTECKHCHGRGIIVHDEPVDDHEPRHEDGRHRRRTEKRDNRDTRDAKKDEAARESSRSRGRKSQHKRHAETSIEELAHSVVAPSDQADDSDEHDAAEEQGAPAKGHKKRRRRSTRSSMRRSSRNSQHGEHHGHHNADAADAQDRDDTAESASATNGEQSYEQAVAEFDNSPRRKRRTRGNSRSDHRPRPEDFTDEANAKADDTALDDAPAAPDDADTENKSSRAGRRGSRRRRRRAVRRARRQSTRSTEQSGGAEGEEHSGKDADGHDETRESKRSDDKRGSDRPRCRGRRRATRRSSRRSTDNQRGSSDNAAGTSSDETGNGRSQSERSRSARSHSGRSRTTRSRTGRGRRRATRRN